MLFYKNIGARQEHQIKQNKKYIQKLVSSQDCIKRKKAFSFA